MISPKRIERLWAACPELRPVCSGRKMTVLPAHPQFPRNGPTWCWKYLGGEVREPTHEDIAHAIIRDRIVWWLAANKAAPKMMFPDGSNGYGSWDAFEDAIAVSVRDGTSSVGVFYDEGSCPSDHGAAYSPVCENTDPTLACILAAERVLNLPDWTEPPTPDVGDFRT